MSRSIVWRYNRETDALELKALRKRWSSAVSVPLRDILTLGKRRASLERTRQKAAAKRGMRKLRKAMKHADDFDGVTVLSDYETFALAHTAQKWKR